MAVVFTSQEPTGRMPPARSSTRTMSGSDGIPRDRAAVERRLGCPGLSALSAMMERDGVFGPPPRRSFVPGLPNKRAHPGVGIPCAPFSTLNSSFPPVGAEVLRDVCTLTKSTAYPCELCRCGDCPRGCVRSK
jgi:hypothetical protein